MTPSEIISTSIAGVALIVALLARLDSKQSATAAQKSAAAAERSNDLMAEQLKLATGELNRQQKKEIEDSRPFFVWKGGAFGGDRFEREFQNVGGEAYNLSIQTTASGISANVHPNNYIPRNNTGMIVFLGQRTLPISFIIKCKTKLEECFERKYALTTGGIVDA